MKLLLDESVPRPLGAYFPTSFEIRTVQRMGWSGQSTRAMIALSEDLGSQGWIALHSLLRANGDCAGICGMTDLGADPDDESPRYFKTTLGQARTSIYARGEHDMKLEIEKEWCIRMAQLEGDAEIGAGRLAVDLVFDGDVIPGVAGDEEGANVAFDRFVKLMRR